MEFTKLGSGDNNNALQLSAVSENNEESLINITGNIEDVAENSDTQVKELNIISPEVCDEHENNLKERIAQCRNVIEALKNELNEEKRKMENVSKSIHCSELNSKYTLDYEHTSSADGLMEDLTFTSSVYSASVTSKLNCDESLVDYEKQLQKYQNTLNMAQMEKKNAIRRQMLSKAYRLKLLEVENQCNIELLRVKQSLQCLEPLQMIASKWKSNTEDLHDNNNFDLLPRYPDFYLKCDSEIGSFIEEVDSNAVIGKPEQCAKKDSALPNA